MFAILAHWSAVTVGYDLASSCVSYTQIADVKSAVLYERADR